jgi:hypothetical protein
MWINTALVHTSGYSHQCSTGQRGCADDPATLPALPSAGWRDMLSLDCSSSFAAAIAEQATIISTASYNAKTLLDLDHEKHTS